MNRATADKNRRLYEFGVFRLDPSERVLARNRERVFLTPKAFDTLLILVQRNGHVVSKDELIKAVWPDSIVEENNLTQQVSQLRRALGETLEGQSYIETVPKLGYRFISEVREIEEAGAELVLSKRTRTHIVLREEEVEEEDDESPVPSTPSAETAQNPARSQAFPAAGTTTVPASRDRKMVVAAVAVAMAAVAGALIYRVSSPVHKTEGSATVVPSLMTTPVKQRYSIAVLGFRNLSGRAENDWLSAALAEMLTTELSAGGQLRVVSGEDVHRIKADLGVKDESSLARATLAQIRGRVGADVIVSGSYVEMGRDANSQIRLDFQLQDTAAGETLLSSAVSGRTQDLFALVARSGTELRSKLGAEQLSSLEGAQDQAALPSNPQAARLYSEGLSRLRWFDAPAAQKLLSRAVAADPDFALGHSALASAWSALGYDEKAKSEARRALDLSLNLSREEHLIIAGQYNEFMRDWDNAVQSYQQLFLLFPDSVDHGIRFASAQISAGKGREALATLKKLRGLAPPVGQDPQIDLTQADADDSLGDFKQELEDSERAIQKGERLGEHLLTARAWIKKSWSLRRLGKTNEAIAGFLEAKRLFAEAGDMQGVGSALRLLGGSQQEHGDFSEADRSFQEAIEIFRQIGDRRSLAMSINGLAIAHYERGDYQAAKALDERYLEIEKEVGSKINTAGALGNIANVEDAQGNLAEARRLNEDSIKIFTEVGDQRALGTALGNLANLLFEQGDLKDAKNKFQQALEIKQKIGYKRGIAYDLSGLSDVFRAAGDLSAARGKQEEALAIRNQLGEKHNAQASLLSLAIVDIEDQKPADAEKIAEEAAQKFETEKLAADEAGAREVEARALLAEGKNSDAQISIDRARNLVRTSSSLPLSFDITATSARIRIGGRLRTATKSPANSSTQTDIKKDLESALSTARRCGYLEYQYKLELALAELELKLGNPQKGRAQLEALAKESKETGFGLIARNASAMLTAQPIHQH